MKSDDNVVLDRGREPFVFHLAQPGHWLHPSVWLRRIREALRARSNLNTLLELSDAQLKDIGVSRSEAYGGYSRYRRSTSHDMGRRCP
jgi:uncharacterized protein YjiS (DUF1127 family)